MKIRIKKLGYAEGGYNDPDPEFYPWPGDKKFKKNKSNYSAAQWKLIAETLDYKGKRNNDEFQEWLINHPEYGDVARELHTNPPGGYGMPNAGKPVDNKLGYRWDAIVNRLLTSKGVEDPEFAPEEESGPVDTSGSKFEFKGDNSKKNKYVQKNLPFYQAAPELAGFISALNTYNYYTPDYTHQEINAPTLNIQSQLQSIDSSQSSFNQTTTGSPQVDNIRKSAAFTQALNAKQQAFSNKQNYDAQGRLQADQFNIGARTQEQNMDVYGVNQVYNNLIPLAKDAAGTERIAALSSLSRKQALNKQNENMKSLYLDNFYQNVEVDENGNLKINSTDNFNYRKYNVEDEQEKVTTSTPSTTVKIPEYKPSISPIVDPVAPADQPTELPAIYGNDEFGNSLWGNPIPDVPFKKRMTTASPNPLTSPILNPNMLQTGFTKGGKKKKKKKLYSSY